MDTLEILRLPLILNNVPTAVLGFLESDQDDDFPLIGWFAIGSTLFASLLLLRAYARAYLKRSSKGRFSRPRRQQAITSQFLLVLTFLIDLFFLLGFLIPYIKVTLDWTQDYWLETRPRGIYASFGALVGFVIHLFFAMAGLYQFAVLQNARCARCGEKAHRKGRCKNDPARTERLLPDVERQRTLSTTQIDDLDDDRDIAWQMRIPARYLDILLDR